jgi:hypothetical protein
MTLTPMHYVSIGLTAAGAVATYFAVHQPIDPAVICAAVALLCSTVVAGLAPSVIPAVNQAAVLDAAVAKKA